MRRDFVAQSDPAYSERYGSRKKFLENHTLRLAAIVGKFIETENPELFFQAKAVAQAMAEELNMVEARRDIEPLATENVIEARQKLMVSVGHLSKACEALEHVEDFPSRQVLEENIRNILLL